jgi:hypothetical protein
MRLGRNFFEKAAEKGRLLLLGGLERRVTGLKKVLEALRGAQYGMLCNARKELLKCKPTVFYKLFLKTIQQRTESRLVGKCGNNVARVLLRKHVV